MNKANKHNLKPKVVASVTLLLLLCVLNYASAPQSATILEAINPLATLAGALFTISYFGAPIWLSVIIVIVLLLLIWKALYAIARRILS